MVVAASAKTAAKPMKPYFNHSGLITKSAAKNPGIITDCYLSLPIMPTVARSLEMLKKARTPNRVQKSAPDNLQSYRLSLSELIGITFSELFWHISPSQKELYLGEPKRSVCTCAKYRRKNSAR